MSQIYPENKNVEKMFAFRTLVLNPDCYITQGALKKNKHCSLESHPTDSQ